MRKEREEFGRLQSTMKEGQAFMKMDRRYNEELEETERKVGEGFKVGLEKLKNLKREREEQKS